MFDANGATKYMRIYVNGNLEAEVSHTDTFSIANKKLFIGKRDGDGNRARMSIDDFRIYDRALSTAEIDKLYNQKYIVTVASLNNNSNISSITGVEKSYNIPKIIISYNRIIGYSYGSGGDNTQPGNSGCAIIRYNYYNEENNKNRVILQTTGYINPYSYVWKGNITDNIDNSYI